MEKHQNRILPELARAEYIEVEPNVHLHITDAGRRQANCTDTRLAIK